VAEGPELLFGLREASYLASLLSAVKMASFGAIYDLEDEDPELKRRLPELQDAVSLDRMADEARAGIRIPVSTPFNDLELEAKKRMPARMFRSGAINTHLTEGQIAFNSRVNKVRRDVFNALRAVWAIIGQFDSFQDFAAKVNHDNADSVLYEAQRRLMATARSQKVSHYATLASKFGCGLKYIDGAMDELQKGSPTYGNPAVDAMLNAARTEVERKKTTSGKGADMRVFVPDPFEARDKATSDSARAFLGLFCIIPMRYTHWTSRFDKTGVGFKIDHTLLQARHGQKGKTAIDCTQTFETDVTRYPPFNEEPHLLKLLPTGRSRMAKVIQDEFRDKYNITQWTKFRMGWEIRMWKDLGISVANDEVKYNNLQIPKRAGHGYKSGQKNYRDANGLAPRLDESNIFANFDFEAENLDLFAENTFQPYDLPALPELAPYVD